MDDGPSTAAKRRSAETIARNAVDFAKQAEKLSHKEPAESPSSVAVQAQFVTPHDPVIITSDGGRLPGVPLEEAHKLNLLRDELEGKPETSHADKSPDKTPSTDDGGGGDDDDDDDESRRVVRLPQRHNGLSLQKSAGGTLRRSMPPSHTNPLFPPLPLYGPPSIMREIQCLFLRVSSFFLSLAFLAVIVLGALFTSAPAFASKVLHRITLRNIDRRRPFHDEEKRRAAIRRQKQQSWERRGGRDPIVCDVGYYARRVGLDVETFQVQTEDGFVIQLWHVFDPKEYAKRDEQQRGPRGPTATPSPAKQPGHAHEKPKFPVLLMHGLLQSSGAYCCNDDESLAFWLCKSGFDVWLGNNRCGFKPQHTKLEYSDPRMWAWNIRQMGVFDLPALTSRVLTETGFEKLGLICHSQGTTETFVALAKEQRPGLGDRLTVFCALAPAAYAGPLIGKIHFKFMRVISPAMFRIMFGVHAFIPFMMQMHALLPARLYGWLGYKVFSFLFNWSDCRWDRGLRDRMFQFAPVYVSAESMRWWLGRECFAKHKCILATRETTKAEDRMDAADNGGGGGAEWSAPETSSDSDLSRERTGATAWYDSHAPPFALWVCGSDDLVDGQRLLRRFRNGREPHVRVVHNKVIDEYEHLDVIWAMDAVDQVFKEVREVLWKTCHARDVFRVPTGCEGVAAWSPAEK
ncbi:alpha/beta-hydrolase lipase [Hirsutella rhossiliensis]|uniref:Alpha/beta-hydrolase lipase n=1 Tax=Hirsutella rhossiliensis TaxID=111463 RepID=A0A9P8MWR4_9HYPO|nr:alpha/beta-hydrolase lipase [Hirsutella rhossiliensis]KAH0963508.1 alpha/beta-hydrolase lipase [Hirsutella rhossiliensis]